MSISGDLQLHKKQNINAQQVYQDSAHAMAALLPPQFSTWGSSARAGGTLLVCTRWL